MVAEGDANPAYDKLIDALPDAEGKTTNVEGVDVASLLPSDAAGAERWVYDGSLTTPPCTEGVKWMVFAKPIEMSASQIAAFTGLYRPQQPPRAAARQPQPGAGQLAAHPPLGGVLPVLLIATGALATGAAAASTREPPGSPGPRTGGEAEFSADVSQLDAALRKRMTGQVVARGMPGRARQAATGRAQLLGLRRQAPHRAPCRPPPRRRAMSSRAMKSLFEHRYPIRRMVLIDRYGADDHRSMAADNTSAFNCRFIAGQPGVWSQHAYGRAIDLNPVENPYVSRAGPSRRPRAGRSPTARSDEPGMIHAATRPSRHSPARDGDGAATGAWREGLPALLRRRRDSCGAVSRLALLEADQLGAPAAARDE